MAVRFNGTEHLCVGINDAQLCTMVVVATQAQVPGSKQQRVAILAEPRAPALAGTLREFALPPPSPRTAIVARQCKEIQDRRMLAVP